MTQTILDQPQSAVWTLALDEIQSTGVKLRPNLPFSGPGDFTGARTAVTRAASLPLSMLLEPVAFDPLTVADDRDFLRLIAEQPTLPEAIRSRLAKLY